MINNESIITNLTGLVGFAEEELFPETEGQEIVPADLYESRSGLYFQEAHPLVTIVNLRLCAEKELTDEQFGKWIQRKVNGSIKKVFNEIYLKKRLDRTFRTFLQDTYLYSGVGNVYAKEVKQGRFMGYQFLLKKQEGVCLKINKLGIQSDTVQAKLKIYVYHTSILNAPIKTIEVAITKANEMNWTNLTGTDEIILKYANDTIDPGGAWFIGYYEDDLVGQAINKEDFNWLLGGCNCGGRELDNWKSWFSVVSVQPFYISSNDVKIDKSPFDITKMIYVNSGKSWGFNFQVNGFCDMTDFVSRNEMVFARAIYYQFAVDVLHEIGYNVRQNRISEKVMQKAIYDLDDRQNSGGVGLKTTLEKELKAVELDFSGLNQVCLPCAKQLVRYGSV